MNSEGSWECPLPTHFYDTEHEMLVKKVLGFENVDAVAYLNRSVVSCAIIRKRWKYDDCTKKTFFTCQKFIEHNLIELKDAFDRGLIKTGFLPAYLAAIIERELNEYGEDWFKNAG